MTRYFKIQLVFFARIILGIVFIYASLDKISHPAAFAAAIGNYHVLPFGLENITGLIMPWLELLVGVMLIAGIMIDGAAIMSAIMMIIFILAISQALARGIDIDCGCFSVSTEDGEKVGLRRLLEDFVYLGFSLIIFYRTEKRFEFFPKSV